MHDVIIIGAGPAGLAAAAYCLRKRLDILVIAPDLGGKANYRMQVAGLEGYEHITGEEVVRKFRSQLQYLDFAQVKDKAAKLEVVLGPARETFAVTTAAGQRFAARAVILATGVDPIRLGAPGEDKALGRGLSYSAVSHAPLFWDKDTAVVGNGDLALRSAAELATVARRVFLVAPAGLPESPLKHKLAGQDNVTILEHYRLAGVETNGFVKGITLAAPDGRQEELPVTGVFGELGWKPQSGLLAGLAALDAEGFVMVDDRCRSSRPGLFAAGDVTNAFGEQVLIAIGEGAKAALAAYDYLLAP
ncbi:MAG: NAD(P)/FAD-dependent oxidoreductase [Caldilineales bacterium]|nr:NAD(P)/FAD-dependent oxidoreductase [Caldilineales bacterium]MCW5860031.1 FAD-dependent oxidoreductase [Caldilineales bacterium]